METISLKLPPLLQDRLRTEAERRHVTKSALIRECLEQALLASKRDKEVSCLDLISDLAGSQPGPADSSTNKNYLKGFGRERKRHR